MRKLTQEEYIRKLAIKNPTIKVVEQYIDEHTPIMHYCDTHNIRLLRIPY